MRGWIVPLAITAAGAMAFSRIADPVLIVAGTAGAIAYLEGITRLGLRIWPRRARDEVRLRRHRTKKRVS